MRYLKPKAQSTLEYVILLGVVVAALIAMNVYIKRSTEGKLRESTDQIGEQYDAGNTDSSYVTTTYSQQNEKTSKGGGSVTTIDSSQNKTGTENVLAWSGK